MSGLFPTCIKFCSAVQLSYTFNGALQIQKSIAKAELELEGQAQKVKTLKISFGGEGVVFIWDTGSEAHIVNDASICVAGSLSPCHVHIIGVGGEGSICKVRQKGKVAMSIGKKNILLEVLIAQTAHLGETAGLSHEPVVPRVLVGGKKFAKDHGLGVFFEADGDTVSIWEGGQKLASATSKSESMYVLSGQHLAKVVEGNDLTIKVNALCAKLLWALPGVIHENSNTIKPDQGGARNTFSQTIHDRMHHGNSAPIIKALREAYPGKFKFREHPCDACAWSSQRMRSVPKTKRRKAKRRGERMHYDLFIMPYRSYEGFKYLLVLIDEATDMIWIFGLKKKSHVYACIAVMLKQVENHIRRRVCELSIGSEENNDYTVITLRSDGAGENLSAEMKMLMQTFGVRLEASIARQQWQNGKSERVGG